MSFGDGGPSWGPGGGQTPDWAALAEESAARARRRKWLVIGGGALATAAVAAIVATAVISAHGDDSGASGRNASALPSPADLPAEPTGPEPSFSSVAPLPPPNPMDFISSAGKDKAPLGADTLFPGRKLTMGDRVYLKGATDRVTNCATATQGDLGTVLVAHGCDQVIRATYNKDGVAVTVGVAVFATADKAKRAAEEATGGIASLSGAGVPTFCRGGAVCRRTANSYGRYAYFAVSGFVSGKSVSKGDQDVFTVGDDLTDFTVRQIHHRGEAQASAAATAAATGQ
ncbi:hypothetical protein ACPXCE_06965 [Streptomyces sp. DT24]|uniref:hypothetical protein n=1 Tax=Streptomyces sp. DT24 TaxID=3416520 RepID=UPI003CEA9629